MATSRPKAKITIVDRIIDLVKFQIKGWLVVILGGYLALSSGSFLWLLFTLLVAGLTIIFFFGDLYGVFVVHKPKALPPPTTATPAIMDPRLQRYFDALMPKTEITDRG